MTKIRDWIVWNKEVKSIISIGNQSEMESLAKVLNETHQTDANEAKEYQH